MNMDSFNRLLNPPNLKVKQTIHCLLVLTFLGISSTVSAQKLKDDDLFDLPLTQLVNVKVQSASRFMQKSSEAPSAVSVVTAEDIRSFGWRTLQDALNALRGLNVRDDRNYTYLGVRGFNRVGDYNSRTLIMINGRRMNDAIFDQGFMGEEFMLDMNLIDRIEYIPGSGSSVHGANAFLGVINIITKQGKDFNGPRLSGEIGSLGTYRGRFTYGKQWSNGADLLLNASQFSSHGNNNLFFPEFSGVNNGIAQDMDQERSSRLFGQLNYHGFTFSAGYVDRYRRVPTASFGAIFNDKTFFTVDRQTFVDLNYNTQINPNLGIQVRGFHHWYNYHTIEAYDINAGESPFSRVVNKDVANARWWGGEFKLIGTQFKNHKWVTGVDLQYDHRQHMLNFDINPYQLYNNSNNNGLRAGVYAQDEYRITDNLILNVGLRLDHHHLIKDLQLNPRAGLIWSITPTLTTKLLYGSAFRAPNIYERDYVYLSANASNSHNREELIKSYEAIAEWYPTDGVRFLGTIFFNDMKKLLVQNPDTAQFVNSGAAHSLGFELEGERRWDSGRLFKVSWMYNHTEMRDEFSNSNHWSRALNSPQNLVKVHYAEPLFNDRIHLGFEEIFVDKRHTLGGNIAPAYHLFNINLALVKPLYGFQASLGIYNVLDQHPKMVAGSEHIQDVLRMDGRTFRFRLERGF